MINIDIHKFTEQLLAPFLRQQKRLSWLNSLFAPIKTIWDSYVVWRTDKFYEAHVTPQTISIQAYLNRLFDSELKRIRIKHSDSNDFYISLWSEPYGHYLNADSDNFFLYLSDEVNDQVLDGFTVEIPQNIDQARLAGVLDKIKAVGTTYEIVVIGS